MCSLPSVQTPFYVLFSHFVCGWLGTECVWKMCVVYVCLDDVNCAVLIERDVIQLNIKEFNAKKYNGD